MRIHGDRVGRDERCVGKGIHVSIFGRVSRTAIKQSPSGGEQKNTETRNGKFYAYLSMVIVGSKRFEAASVHSTTGPGVSTAALGRNGVE